MVAVVSHVHAMNPKREKAIESSLRQTEFSSSFRSSSSSITIKNPHLPSNTPTTLPSVQFPLNPQFFIMDS
ncbi:hypothetical protein L1987_16415 [Smallanthus sonchifolius]|uniref:Uncharacterized protein n=1 Tax=Smallanthus sonchifolius TaxID=185202 RepID=A0ACB9J999_9ASTR|nr:hypothetical protein L1987_16415 [Smallanthus sonchifolius]